MRRLTGKIAESGAVGGYVPDHQGLGREIRVVGKCLVRAGREGVRHEVEGRE